jgi:uncharacterized membrane protein
MAVPDEPRPDPALAAEPPPAPSGGAPASAGGGPPAGPSGAAAASAAGREVDAALRFHLHDHLLKIEHLLAGAGRRVARGEGLPAWLRETPGEARWPVAIVVLVAIGLQLVIPARLSVSPTWLPPAVELALLVLLVIANPRRIERDERWIRFASLALVAVASFANAWSAFQLVRGLVLGRERSTALLLLTVGGAIWLTNVIVFALWYWELDRGGPVARSKGIHEYPDFLFPQMQMPVLAPEHWEPGFLDYLYVSFTNATAFSPTDTMPLSRWAKMLMLGQASVSLATVALVVARAVNILK